MPQPECEGTLNVLSTLVFLAQELIYSKSPEELLQ